MAAACLAIAAPVVAQVQLTCPFPPLRDNPTVAWEPNTGEGYLFGGYGWNDLWRHADGLWVPVTTPSAGPVMAEPHAATWPGHGMLVVGTILGGQPQTWLFDGTDWSQLPVATPQGVRAMAFDPVRGVMVGWCGGPVHEFDGANWSVAPAAPTASWGALAWHANLQRIVLLTQWSSGFFTTRLYSAFDGANWSSLGITSGPVDRASLSPTVSGDIVSSGGYGFPFDVGLLRFWPIASAPANVDVPPRWYGYSWYDPIRLRTVVTHAAQASEDHRGTYYVDAAGSQVSGAGVQPPWAGAAACWDSWRGGYLLAYGRYQADFYGGLWQWLDGGWQQISATPPSHAAVSQAGCAFDSRRGRMVVVCGGVYDNGSGAWVANLGVREWDGSAWHPLPSGGPSAREVPGFAYDPVRQRCVLFGGAMHGGGTLTDTWEWDGSAWQAFAPTTVPPAGEGLVFDRERGQCVLAAGSSLWSWDGANWHALAIPWSGGELGYDVARDRLVRSVAAPVPMQQEWDGTAWVTIGGSEVAPVRTFNLATGTFMGYDGRGLRTLGDPAAATIQPFGAGCLGTVGVPVLHGEAPPRLGHALALRVEHLPVGAPWIGVLGRDVPTWLGLPLPIDLTPAGMPGCAVLAPLEVDELRSGADWPIAVPNAPALLGGTFAVQAYVFDAAANALGLTLSNGVRLRCGA